MKILIILFLLAGCATIQVETFESCVAKLKTSSEIEIWIKANTSYINKEVDEAHEDFIYGQAKELWQRKVGWCSNFACFYIYCLRTHGQTCGTIFSVYRFFSHQRGWIQEPDGSISISDNQRLFKKRFKSYEDMITNWKEKGYHVFRDSEGRYLKTINK